MPTAFLQFYLVSKFKMLNIQSIFCGLAQYLQSKANMEVKFRYCMKADDLRVQIRITTYSSLCLQGMSWVWSLVEKSSGLSCRGWQQRFLFGLLCCSRRSYLGIWYSALRERLYYGGLYAHSPSQDGRKGTVFFIKWEKERGIFSSLPGSVRKDKFFTSFLLRCYWNLHP